MWEEYDRIRGHRTKYFRQLLIKPVDLKFVKVRVFLGMADLLRNLMLSLSSLSNITIEQIFLASHQTSPTNEK
jgi:hypothetical protein